MIILVLIGAGIFLFIKWQNHVENSIKRVEGQIERASKENNPEDKK